MRFSHILLITPVIFLTYPSVSPAGAGLNTNAKIACHLVAHSSKTLPCQSPPKPPCNPGSSAFTTHGNLNTPYDLYILVADGDSSGGIAAAEFGIAYKGTSQEGLDVLGWTLCGDAEYGSHPDAPAWPLAGSGTIIVWDHTANCQKATAIGDLDAGVTAVAGCLYVYAFSNDIFKITKRPLISPPVVSVVGCGKAAVRDTLDFPRSVGKVAFGQGGGGFDPCQ